MDSNIFVPINLFFTRTEVDKLSEGRRSFVEIDLELGLALRERNEPLAVWGELPQVARWLPYIDEGVVGEDVGIEPPIAIKPGSAY